MNFPSDCNKMSENLVCPLLLIIDLNTCEILIILITFLPPLGVITFVQTINGQNNQQQRNILKCICVSSPPSGFLSILITPGWLAIQYSFCGFELCRLPSQIPPLANKQE